MGAGIVVAGASMGGLRAAEQLRAAGWSGRITVIGDEPHMPYNRPPLSKEVLAGRAPFASLAFTPKAAAADVRWRLGVRAVAARLDERTVSLDDGSTLPYDALVVATGMRPRRLRCPGPLAGRHTVRTIDDAQGLRDELTRPGVRVVVVGAGFIGCEVAATAVALGVTEVTVVDPLPLPMVGPLGELLGRALLKRHEERGVRFALGTGVAGFEGEDRVTGVVLSDGTVLEADVVVESVGSVANTEWLDGNGLDLSDGVLTDAHLRAGGRRDVVAVGDVARFPNARYDGVARRVEHWSIPTDTAKHAAKTLVGAETAPFAPLPTFWSDQHEFRLQSFGAPVLGKDDVRILDGDPEGDVLVGYHTGGRLVGVVALGGQAAAMGAARYRAQLLKQPALTA
ncbi:MULTISPECIES: FAD-dependent oxidoreductase [unclassified Streptomyces]|uniref:NAD(P)/FAD-dependent oxidoreductase n=1 Tax=unclassified Streptomyces TaxID=2593676 RepID=UPI000F4D85F4|nr:MULTISPECIES: FAD-dependent oxidoreductase [unclassified Streptomyces]MDH6448075.1 3-phenylpropionate/trans-cinnamate dioxygenase ferredoxin reductase subunit [Streptomyces sp. SAI-119]MDH6501202.1 3-phenylpropionate/trans-cinnamate dioxygenase ferredoxin reductase subunit [Streptomyces sp. SAI-149]QUC60336.1 FAD-dependent oxidoreductase [Streptomyces sp. A2-16]GLP64135.1 ferredoxin reductase [Streptomyces sp. TUS-ST3]